MNKLKLEAGQLYQVNYGKVWIIAEYVCEVAAHSYKYNNIYMDTLTTGPEKVKHVPLSHRFRKVGRGSYSQFTVEDRGMQTRPVTPETLSTISILKSEIKRLETEQQERRQELRELCN